MAMINCPECGNEVSSLATTCPKCGHPMKLKTSENSNIKSNYTSNQPEKKKKKKGSCIGGLIVIIAIVAVIAAIGGGGDKEETKKTSSTNTAAKATEESQKEAQPQEEIMEIDPDTLLTDYEANEVRGDELYDEKMMRISGTVGSIGKDIMEDVYITFATAEEYSITSVQCYFSDDEQIKKVMELAEGDIVTIVGRCDGKFGNVLIRDCTFE
ncbi:hypothetical protein MCG98_18765 [Ruminococcus sp. OA3]|uniref:OB-fold protein n=1 Tax=Ruminococcus sp. OA3 TaxID=2914164 RepID=UPI001F054CC4|nr:zinc ribbon domain-containing protein [Ruminococcus sp. OA3]MCH1980969.1 hypothetical protein [Ruminococcus sp. OA3]MCH1984586.1 hypothetical protein [Ruminococcus sp. OA3]MCH1984601.1 hypothetical protein [Ruminococcus sp. OA3]